MPDLNPRQFGQGELAGMPQKYPKLPVRQPEVDEQGNSPKHRRLQFQKIVDPESEVWVQEKSFNPNQYNADPQTRPPSKFVGWPPYPMDMSPPQFRFPED